MTEENVAQSILSYSFSEELPAPEAYDDADGCEEFSLLGISSLFDIPVIYHGGILERYQTEGLLPARTTTYAASNWDWTSHFASIYDDSFTSEGRNFRNEMFEFARKSMNRCNCMFTILIPDEA